MGFSSTRGGACCGALVLAFATAQLASGCNAFTGADDLAIGDDDDASSGSPNGVGGGGTGGAGVGAGMNTSQLLPSDAASITSIEVYQGVRRAVMEGGAPVSAGVPIVAGRNALMRIHYTATVATTVTAVLDLGDGPQIAITTPVQGTSSIQDFGSTINIDIPAERMTAGANYSVSLLEAPELTSGANGGAVYPASGQEPLGIQSVGAINIVLVPIAYRADGSNRVPDPQVEVYRSAFQAVYPVPDVNITVAATMQWGQHVDRDGTGWGNLLDAVVGYRQQNGAGYNDHYYGIFMPTTSFSSFCQGACVAGLSYLAQSPGDEQARAGIGMGYSGGDSAQTAVHEIGHQHGREHAPCQVSDADPGYPHSGGAIGEWGYDLASGVLIQPSAADFMGYCDPTWVSDYTYSALFNRLVAINGSASWQVAPELMNRDYERVRIDVEGVTWGEPVTLERPPIGNLTTLTVSDQEGTYELQGHYFPYSHLPGGMLMFPRQEREVQAVSFDIDGLRQRVDRADFSGASNR